LINSFAVIQAGDILLEWIEAALKAKGCVAVDRVRTLGLRDASRTITLSQ
jgi:hypothetical protein